MGVKGEVMKTARPEPAAAARHLLLGALLWLGVAGGVAAEAVFPAETWATPSPEAPSRWSSEKLKVADAFAASLRTDAYLVIDHGVLVHSYGDIDKPMNLASVRKSVLGLLTGMQVDSGAIDLDQTLADLDIDDKEGLTPTERGATVRQLLQSRSGVYHPAAYETPEARRLRPVRGSHAPGAFFYYNNWDFNALGTIFERRAGKTVFEALQRDLAEPLQFQDFRPAEDTRWVRERASEHPAYVMHLSARDLARVGLLAARNGRWGDRQLVSAAWIAESTVSYSTVSPGWSGYGYLWWVPLRAFPFWTRGPHQLSMAVGDGGQFMLVDRERDLVVVHRMDNDRVWFRRERVTIEQFAELAARIHAAVPPPP